MRRTILHYKWPLTLLSLVTVTACTEVKSVSGFIWTELDINDPSLPKATVMLQCKKSLMYAPRQLEAWCEKAYELGYWRALEFIGLHTGDGSRYIAEVKERAEKGSLDGVLALAYAYKLGRFIDRDVKKSIALFKRYLNEYNYLEAEGLTVGKTHEQLYLLYKELGNTEKAAEHKLSLDKSKYAEVKKAMLKK